MSNVAKGTHLGVSGQVLYAHFIICCCLTVIQVGAKALVKWTQIGETSQMFILISSWAII